MTMEQALLDEMVQWLQARQSAGTADAQHYTAGALRALEDLALALGLDGAALRQRAQAACTPTDDAPTT